MILGSIDFKMFWPHTTLEVFYMFVIFYLNSRLCMSQTLSKSYVCLLDESLISMTVNSTPVRVLL